MAATSQELTNAYTTWAPTAHARLGASATAARDAAAPAALYDTTRRARPASAAISRGNTATPTASPRQAPGAVTANDSIRLAASAWKTLRSSRSAKWRTPMTSVTRKGSEK